mgnify:CR=1 FL=1
MRTGPWTPTLSITAAAFANRARLATWIEKRHHPLSRAVTGSRYSKRVRSRAVRSTTTHRFLRMTRSWRGTCVGETDHPVLGRLKTLGSPLKLGSTPTNPRRRAPLLGEHTDEILTEFGFSDEEIAALRSARSHTEGGYAIKKVLGARCWVLRCGCKAGAGCWCRACAGCRVRRACAACSVVCLGGRSDNCRVHVLERVRSCRSRGGPPAETRRTESRGSRRGARRRTTVGKRWPTRAAPRTRPRAASAASALAAV